MTRATWKPVVLAVCVAVAGLATGGTMEAHAQQSGPPAVAGAPASDVAGDTAARRQALVNAIRRKFEQVVRQQLHLTDTQMRQLRQTNRRFDAQRRVLNERARAIRQAMREELRPGVAANEAHLAALTDSLFGVQRARLDLLQQEQQELSQYMTVVQRVRYYALEDQLRQKLEQLRQRLRQRAAAQPAF